MLESILLENESCDNVLWSKKSKLGIEAKGHRLQKFLRETRVKELKLKEPVFY
jgi:hypothetical protein